MSGRVDSLGLTRKGISGGDLCIQALQRHIEEKTFSNNLSLETNASNGAFGVFVYRV